ncbi:MAG: hypothetical protein AAB778_02430 [Patescibacteria group bacterium]
MEVSNKIEPILNRRALDRYVEINLEKKSANGRDPEQDRILLNKFWVMWGPKVSEVIFEQHEDKLTAITLVSRDGDNVTLPLEVLRTSVENVFGHKNRKDEMVGIELKTEHYGDKKYRIDPETSDDDIYSIMREVKIGGSRIKPDTKVYKRDSELKV